MKKLLLLTVCLLAVTCFALPKDSDPRLKYELDHTTLKYSFDDDGDAKIIFGNKDNSINVYVISNTNFIRNSDKQEISEYREIQAYPAEKVKMTPKLLHNMLRMNMHYVVGSWNLTNKNNPVFVLHIPASTTAAELERFLNIAAVCARDFKEDVITYDLDDEE